MYPTARGCASTAGPLEQHASAQRIDSPPIEVVRLVWDQRCRLSCTCRCLCRGRPKVGRDRCLMVMGQVRCSRQDLKCSARAARSTRCPAVARDASRPPLSHHHQFAPSTPRAE